MTALSPTVPATIPFKLSRAKTDLFSALLRAKSQFGASKVAIVDGDEREITYKEIVRAAFGLGNALKKLTKKDEKVGVLLPTGAGAVIAFYALEAFGRVPAMLNFTAGAKNLLSALKAAEVTKIVTAHQFVELGNLQPLIEQLFGSAEFVYLEDVREGLTLSDQDCWRSRARRPLAL